MSAKIDYDQQAHEMAERCAKALLNAAATLDYAGRKDFIRTRSELILRELNLASLLEDKARLDWLQTGHCVLCLAQDSNIQPYTFQIDGHQTAPYNEDVRTAITNAMKEDK